MSEKKRALVLISGGLDSLLAAAILAKQGIALLGLHYTSPFTSGEHEKRKVQSAASEVGIKPRIEEITETVLSAVKDPEYGYGSAMNPCVDCRLSMLSQAKEYMKSSGAEFLVTGEVPGQRPMTQRSKDQFRFFEKRANLQGMIVRPLCAKLLPPSIPEKRGWVDREAFYGIDGRSRQKQLQLAQEYGLSNYTQPGGGCLFTDKQFAHRLKELFNARGRKSVSKKDVRLLKFGRHFRLPRGSKAVIGRDEGENNQLQQFGDAYWHLETVSIPGPHTILTGDPTAEEYRLAAQLTARYTGVEEDTPVEVRLQKGDEAHTRKIRPLATDDPLIDELMVLAD